MSLDEVMYGPSTEMRLKTLNMNTEVIITMTKEIREVFINVFFIAQYNLKFH